MRAIRVEHGVERRLERRAGEQVLRRRHGLAEVLEVLAREVALLAQLREGGAELGRGLGVGLDELARPRVGPRGPGPLLGRSGRRRDPDHGVARGAEAGEGGRSGARGGGTWGRGSGIGRVAGEAYGSNERCVRPKSSMRACSAHCLAGAPSLTSRIA